MPITIPAGVTVKIDGSVVTVKGPKGELKRTFNPGMVFSQKDNVLTVARPSESKEDKALHGLSRSLLANMVTGVATGFSKDLEIVGIGYRAEKAGAKLVLRVGQSHPMEVEMRPGISFAIEGTTKVKLSGADKEAIGEMAADIRAMRKPDHYKGKGIRYAGERIKLKPGKAGKVIGKKAG